MSSQEFLSRGIDYLGDLGAKLRDLQGYRTLAHELIQNADDASTATEMRFDIADEALIVDNDGVFSDCHEAESAECPWKALGRGHRCDFHRFRFVASGDKRGESDTTGAFGIGFIAVYQITDRPEVISAGRHWKLLEDRPESERIQVCPGCPKCRGSELPGTRFILPWAQDSGSKLRVALGAEPVGPDAIDRMLVELRRSVPVAMLFLRRLRKIEVKRHSLSAVTQRLVERDSLILSNGSETQLWHLLRGDFDADAATLRAAHPARIEGKRASRVTLAIPDFDLKLGLLCSGLPTEHSTGFPFHINADFFTTNDRKRVVLAEDYQSRWNRSAIAAAAATLAGTIDQIPRLLGASRFWAMTASLKEAHDKAEAGQAEVSLAAFWAKLAPTLKTSAVVQTTNQAWALPANTCLLLQREEAEAIPLLEALDLAVVHEDLRPHQSMLRSPMVGVPVLDLVQLANRLRSIGLTQRIEASALPAALNRRRVRDLLYGEIALLLDRHRSQKSRSDAERLLVDLAIAPGRDGALWPCNSIFLGDEITVRLFNRMGAGTSFVSAEESFTPLLGLCRRFDVASAIDALRRTGMSRLEKDPDRIRLALQVLEWFEARRIELFSQPALSRNLAELALFPSATTLRPLNELAVPGDFVDPLQLTEVVDLKVVGKLRDFLISLGMPQLDFITYACSRLPKALCDPAVPQSKRRGAIALLATRLGAIKDKEEVRQSLAATPLVECADGMFERPHECYFESEEVKQCLGNELHFAVLPKGLEAATRDLFEWVGVADQPRMTDLVARVSVLTRGQYSSASRKAIQTISTYLAQQLAEAGADSAHHLSSLCQERWLPARGRADRWYAPAELFAAFQDYLFESQALFVDFATKVQAECSKLFEFLRIGSRPPVLLVVRHLLHCAQTGTGVNSEVYRFLNDNSSEIAVRELIGQKCLRLGNSYYAPNEVFWGESPFGRYRRRLGDDLRRFSGLLTQLGVRESPSHHDALSVIREISEEYGRDNLALNEESFSVLMACWRSLEKGLSEGAINAQEVASLRSTKCIPKSNRVLNPPIWMFFENRAGLAAKFGEFLIGNVIARPLNASRAMAAAGVRTLGSAVDVQLLECENPRPDADIEVRIRSRTNEIARVLESFRMEGASLVNLEKLSGIKCERADKIVIRYHLTFFDRELDSAPETVPALFDRERNVLLLTARNLEIPWPSLARELAVALFPEQDPGHLAAGFKECLEPATASDSASALDELGFARLDTDVRALPLVIVEEALGNSDSSPAGRSTESDQAKEENDSISDVAPIEAPSSPQSTSPSQQPPRDVAPSARTSRQLARPVLRSYVPAPNINRDAHDATTDIDQAQRTAVDQAGVALVMAYEFAAGRMPVEMDHNHKGYDIQSCDANGNVLRYIEVKSCSMDWSNTYAVLSKAQFDEARMRSESFWLYVVERAGSETARMYRIHNPATQANHFMFDDGWRAMAEGEATTGDKHVASEASVEHK